MNIAHFAQATRSYTHRFIPYTYGLFLAGFFLIPNAVDQYKYFSVAVFVPALFIAGDLLGGIKRHPLWLLGIALLGWMLTSSFWSAEFSSLEFFKTFRLAIYILTFIALSVYLFNNKPELFRKTLLTVCLTGGVAALISIPLWYSEHAFPASRLIGIGTLENTNTSSYLYGFHALLSLWLAPGEKSTLLKRLLYANTIILMCFVFLTQSNTGIIATTGSSALLLLGRRGGHLALKLLGILVLTYAFVFLSTSIGMRSKPLDSGLSARIEIWQTVIKHIHSAPVLGHGYQKPPRLNPNNNLEPPYYTHNTLLGIVRDGGLVGGSIYLCILLYAGYISLRLYRESSEPFYIACLFFGIAGMLTDTDEVITRPRELWVLFWLPLALLIAGDLKRTPRT